MSSFAAIEHHYHYPFLSELLPGNGSGILRLATSRNEGFYPYFLEGRLLKPRVLACLLTALSKLLAARYYTLQESCLPSWRLPTLLLPVAVACSDLRAFLVVAVPMLELM